MKWSMMPSCCRSCGGKVVGKFFEVELPAHFCTLKGQHEAAHDLLLSRGFTMPEFAKMNETKCPKNGCSGDIASFT